MISHKKTLIVTKGHSGRLTAIYTHLLRVSGSGAGELGVVAGVDLKVHGSLLYQRLATNQKDATLTRLVEQILCLTPV